ncbi:hypothetical protein GGE67_006127 [Rhizobium leucaenae]|uniref:Uncharacterized protein n=1 Tax=Rhizobium leucaenae TaxID=29450 RepID=A0A7W7EMN7_9HYPH|nr:hypothetical protein [Rhizobium leucaenae]MBB6305458.1 hypothetical protein [Rhizobium leucaenae]
MGLFSDFALNLDDVETLRSIITDACDELKIPHDHAGLVARVLDLHAEGRSRHEIIKILRTEFCKSRI